MLLALAACDGGTLVADAGAIQGEAGWLGGMWAFPPHKALLLEAPTTPGTGLLGVDAGRSWAFWIEGDEPADCAAVDGTAPIPGTMTCAALATHVRNLGTVGPAFFRTWSGTGPAIGGGSPFAGLDASTAAQDEVVSVELVRKDCVDGAPVTVGHIAGMIVTTDGDVTSVAFHAQVGDDVQPWDVPEEDWGAPDVANLLRGSVEVEVCPPVEATSE